MATTQEPAPVEAVAPWAEPVLMTADELLLLPEDGWCYELVEGRLVRMAPTGGSHGRTVAALYRAIDRYVQEHRLGEVLPAETGFRISSEGEPDTVLAPDIAFVRQDRERDVGVEGYPGIAPDLVVEVTSPSQGRKRMTAKAQRWLNGGVRLVWIVLPATHTVEAWRPGEPVRVMTADDELSGEDILPGFTFPVRKLFAARPEHLHEPN